MFDLMFKFDKITSDSGWENDGGIPSRGINDFVRVVSASSRLSNEELDTICKELKDDPKCPGWTGVTYAGRKDNETLAYIYKFYTTWDSSD